ncbi:cation-transporting P-type ATPase [Candidatus Vondammii sp. HM_W22]|uniref:cation-transporting P-type ATPase n=1 Tax=Candidatus Vondammii sp. HM_W22 TaxID=2687299 RepID=UPI001F128FEB|nr:cation-transporting P-type ATPase [Candidatus Vondammii sp. HM_W22]
MTKQTARASTVDQSFQNGAKASPDHWYATATDDVLRILETSTHGLSASEAKLRLGKHGENRLPEARPRGPLLRFLSQFHNVLIYVLIGAGVVTMLLKHWIDASVIFGVVLINAAIGFIQEGKAENALRAIRQMLSPHAMAYRDGKRITISATELVPGDVVALQSGDRVPADLRLFKIKNLQIQESVLTGESVATEKNTQPVAADAVLGDRFSMAYSGTLVTYGQGTGVVVTTGSQTEIGCISTLVSGVDVITTPMLRQIARFGRWLTAAILAIATITFAFGVLIRQYAAADMFTAVVGLAVAAIPEGLPAIMTITLAIGVQRMAQRRAIIRRLPAVETLGAVGVICSDKTGTLTRNEMTLRSIITADNHFHIEGTGYDFHGAFLREQVEISPDDYPSLLETIRAAILCNDATLERQGDLWQVHGNPMEGALLVAGHKANMEPEQESKRYPRTDLIPFEAQHRFMATLHHSHTGEAWIFLKGAPEQVLDLCLQQRSDNGNQPIDPAYWEQQTETLATKGQRVLAVAFKPAASHQTELDFTDVGSGMVLLGLLGLIDPPREEAISAIAKCQAAGIRVKMITGDHATTAQAIAWQLNLKNREDVLTGKHLDTMSEDELQAQVWKVDIYARVSPEHKLRLVHLLQSHGAVVAMTGDGVNDAPALKRADVGTAMGQAGTEAAKEASEMVLADDNFASIAYAVEEGRTVYDNLKKAILFILPTNGGEALVIMTAILLGFQELPLTPAQILWVNMITAVTLALALAFEPAEHDVMKRPPRNPREAILSRLLLWRIAFVSLIITAGCFGLFFWEMEQGSSIERARTVAVNTLVMFEIFYLFNSRYISAPVLNIQGLLGNRYILIAVAILILFQLLFTYWAPMQMLFGTSFIEPLIWLRIILVASTVLFLVEIEKSLIRKFMRNGRH